MLQQRLRSLPIYLLFLFLVFISSLAHADVVWPALYLETRLFSWWAITFGLVVEYFFVRTIFNLPIKKATIATFTANFVSSLVGLLAIPIASIFLEISPGIVIHKLFNIGTFNPFTWGATFVIACLINSLIESAIYIKVFKLSFFICSKTFSWVFIANIASLWVVPLEL